MQASDTSFKNYYCSTVESSQKIVVSMSCKATGTKIECTLKIHAIYCEIGIVLKPELLDKKPFS